MPGEVKDKKLDPTSRSTWARLESAGRSPVGGKPFAAERMDLRAAGVDPLDLLEGEETAPDLRATDARASVEPAAIEGGVAHLAEVEVVLDGWPDVVFEPELLGAVVGRAVALASKRYAVVAVHVSSTSLRLVLRVDPAQAAGLGRWHALLHARLAAVLS